jgi:hypothetical protein
MFRFYDAVERWSEIEPHLADEEFQRVLTEDFNKLTLGRWGVRFPTPDKPWPGDWEDFGGEARTEDDGPWLGPEGEYRKLVKNLACFFLVNCNLRLATLVLPGRKWRIVLSRFHSTVYDGHDLLFDLTGLALYGDPDLAWEYAFGMGRQLPVGAYFPVKFAPPYERKPYRRGVR